MSLQVRFLKLTFAINVEVDNEKKKWVASSSSLNLACLGDTPEEAVDNIQKEIQSAENEEGRKRKAAEAVRAKKEREDVKQKAKEVAEKSDKKAEQVVESEDTEFAEFEPEEGSGELTVSELEKLSVAELRTLAEENDVEFEGLKKVQLREKLIAELSDAEDE